MGEKSHRTIQLRKESRDGKSKGQVISRFAAGHALSAWVSIAKGGEVNSVYIIEDDGALRVELARLFELNGFAVRLCERFDAAAQLALLERPDCILLDLKLPGVDGLSVCRAIRAKDSTTPIIVLTSSDTEFDEVMSMNLGADDYVTKPYSPAVPASPSGSIPFQCMRPLPASTCIAPTSQTASPVSPLSSCMASVPPSLALKSKYQPSIPLTSDASPGSTL